MPTVRDGGVVWCEVCEVCQQSDTVVWCEVCQQSETVVWCELCEVCQQSEMEVWCGVRCVRCVNSQRRRCGVV